MFVSVCVCVCRRVCAVELFSQVQTGVGLDESAVNHFLYVVVTSYVMFRTPSALCTFPLPHS